VEKEEVCICIDWHDKFDMVLYKQFNLFCLSGDVLMFTVWTSPLPLHDPCTCISCRFYRNCMCLIKRRVKGLGRKENLQRSHLTRRTRTSRRRKVSWTGVTAMMTMKVYIMLNIALNEWMSPVIALKKPLDVQP
jgi:hypothetical protein